MHAEAMHDAVIGDVDERVRGAKGDEEPGEPAGSADRVEQQLDAVFLGRREDHPPGEEIGRGGTGREDVDGRGVSTLAEADLDSEPARAGEEGSIERTRAGAPPTDEPAPRTRAAAGPRAGPPVNLPPSGGQP